MSAKTRKVESNGRRLSTHAREIEQILKENEVESLDLKFLGLGPGKITLKSASNLPSNINRNDIPSHRLFPS